MYKVKEIEIGLINNCNLSCPLCTRSKKIFSSSIKMSEKYEIDYDTLINFLDELPDLELVNLVGSTSEPMIYKKIVDLCRYLKIRGIRITISTNGSLQKKSIWEELSKILQNEDQVIFAVDGTTQEIHEKNRIGSKLKKILENNNTLRQGEATTVMQYILFNYNVEDAEKAPIFSQNNNFSTLRFEHCYSYTASDYEQKNLPTAIPLITNLYTKITHRKGKITCEARELDNSIYMNHMGEVMPCCHINEHVGISDTKYLNIYDNTKDEIFDNILRITKAKAEEPCSKFCSNINKHLFKQYNIDP
jgi:organic radical activating enzyme